MVLVYLSAVDVNAEYKSRITNGEEDRKETCELCDPFADNHWILLHRYEVATENGKRGERRRKKEKRRIIYYDIRRKELDRNRQMDPTPHNGPVGFIC
jgi:hypothetical protein